MDELLGIDGVGEASTCLLAIGAPSSEGRDTGAPGDLAPVGGESVITAPGEIDYPDIRETHAATLLTHAGEVENSRGSLGITAPEPDAPFFAFPDIVASPLESRPLGQTIRERGSTRRFDHVPISLDQLAAVVGSATAGVPADFLGGPADSLLDLYLIVNAVDDLPGGAYYYSPIPERSVPVEGG